MKKTPHFFPHFVTFNAPTARYSKKMHTFAAVITILYAHNYVKRREKGKDESQQSHKLNEVRKECICGLG